MPILDVDLVLPDGDAPPAAALTQALADAAGRSFGLRTLPASHYAENGALSAPAELPAFVTELQARPPEGKALAREVTALTHALAACLGRAPGRVHVQYAPPAAGRQAFGGTLVR